jgi:hypothetical protein
VQYIRTAGHRRGKFIQYTVSIMAILVVIIKVQRRCKLHEVLLSVATGMYCLLQRNCG